MPGLAEQRLIIGELEGRVAVNRERLIEAVRTVDLPVDGAMVTAGTALIAVELAPAIKAVAGLFSGDKQPGKPSKQLLKVALEIPLLVRALSRLTRDSSH